MDVEPGSVVHFAVKTPENELVTWLGDEPKNGCVRMTWGLYHTVVDDLETMCLKFLDDTGYEVTDKALIVTKSGITVLEGTAVFRRHCDVQGVVHLVPMHQLHGLLEGVRPSDDSQLRYMKEVFQRSGDVRGAGPWRMPSHDGSTKNVTALPRPF